ncbi:hypothetical protein HDV03_002044 [Kappamyces sp. JEL0829]|nr:hypothetical protein HDV03_002044 [Kappamyces sp. JEL0829]
MQENMDRQMRMMQSQMVAGSREVCYWLVPTYSTFLTAAIGARLAGKPVNLAIVPLTILGVVTAYQIDMAWGNKVDRIRTMQQKILYEEDHWFSKVEKELAAKQASGAK